MQVVVALEEAGAGGGDEGLEERGWAGRGCEAETGGADVSDEAFEETDLGEEMLVPRARIEREALGKIREWVRSYMPDEWQALEVQKSKDESQEFPNTSLASEAELEAQSRQCRRHCL